jgi:hypothetical protein
MGPVRAFATVTDPLAQVLKGYRFAVRQERPRRWSLPCVETPDLLHTIFCLPRLW